jgi:hypothetical protein
MLRPAEIAHMLAPMPRWHTTLRPRGGRVVELRQHRGDVLVGQAVEAIAAHALVVQFHRQCEHLRQFGLRAVEGGVEAGHLRHARLAFEHQPDRHQVVRLVQRRQRDELLQVRQHFAVHAHRRRVLHANMHDAMADAL